MSTPLPSRTRLVLTGLTWAVVGALVAASLGLLAFVPGELMMTADSAAGAHVAWPLALGVAAVCGRAGAVAGLIAYFLKRSLLGETVDPREAAGVTATKTAPRP
jgi:hypothetical protein